jgi:hypothetical protein
MIGAKSVPAIAEEVLYATSGQKLQISFGYAFYLCLLLHLPVLSWPLFSILISRLKFVLTGELWSS